MTGETAGNEGVQSGGERRSESIAEVNQPHAILSWLAQFPTNTSICFSVQLTKRRLHQVTSWTTTKSWPLQFSHHPARSDRESRPRWEASRQHGAAPEPVEEQTSRWCLPLLLYFVRTFVCQGTLKLGGSKLK